MPDQSAILRSYINSGDYTRVEIGMNAVVRLLSNKLIFQLTPRFKHFNYTGYHDISRNPFSATIYAAYYLGNFNFDGYYQTREHNLNSTDGSYAGNRSSYFLRIGWNHRNWNLSISANNFARTNGYDGNWNDIVTPLYSNHTVSYTSNYHAFYAISAVYTFGYGKKIQQGNEVGRQYSAGSAIMK
jgi:hypothetical protein